MKLPDREIPAEMERVLARLGGGWQLTAGAADAYGNSWMQFVELRSATHETAVSVWWAGSEIWIQAFLGVPYEASAELISGSATFIARVVHALCTGDFVRRNGLIELRVGWARVQLTEWPDAS
jgi:hypothetical protein